MNTEIIIPATKNDPRAYGVQKYSNGAPWNVAGGIAPNGVSATRYLRKSAPDVAQLSPLAAWLFTHAPKCVAGNMPAFAIANRVKCFIGLTSADMLRRDSPADADGFIKCYGELLDQPARIDDWLFPVTRPDWSDEKYWNSVATGMIAAGVVRVQIGDAVLEVAQ